jgi:diguanylate cyclase (GGDEF)-like protein
VPNVHPPFTLYLRFVSAAGLALLIALPIAGAGGFGPLDLEFCVLAGFVLLGELFPIQVHGQVGEETFSTPFGFALLLIYGLPEVAIVQVLSSLAADLVRRRPPDRVLFNLAQLTVSWAAAGAVLELAGGTGLSSGVPLAAADLPVIVAAALAFFVANSTLVRTAEALLQRSSIPAHLREDLLFRGWSAATLFALGPPVAVIAEDWLYLVPALALPMAAVHRASKQASEMEHLALHDTLTSLPNRTLLRQRAADALRDAAEQEHAAALVTIGLDRFRDVNDTFGRAQGDALLVEVAERLTRSVRSSDTVARAEGDKFAVLIPSVAGLAEAEGAARNILDALSRPLEVAGVTVSVDASAGIACFPEHGSDPDLLLQRADSAMYRAKRAQSRLEFYAPGFDEEAPRRLVMLTALKEAIDARRVRLHYQPKLDLASRRVVGLEALARWTDAELGTIEPTTFVSLVERTGLAEPFTDLVLETAAADSRRWREEGCPVPVAVNVSTDVLLDPRFAGTVEALLQRFDLEAGALEIEITESTLMGDHARAREALARLESIGVRTAIDDFGTGYSSLAYLRELPVHALKIDRSFISGLTAEPDSEAIVRSIIELARNLRLETVAEGIEDERVCERLTRLGCDLGQGFALARPMPADETLDWLLAQGAQAG